LIELQAVHVGREHQRARVPHGETAGTTAALRACVSAARCHLLGPEPKVTSASLPNVRKSAHARLASQPSEKSVS
jgi:hypothetical protein